MYGDLWGSNTGVLRNHRRKINDLAENSQGYRYAIPQEFLSDINRLVGLLGNWVRPYSSISGELAPFCSLLSALGKRAGKALLHSGPDKSGSFIARLGRSQG